MLGEVTVRICHYVVGVAIARLSCLSQAGKPNPQIESSTTRAPWRLPGDTAKRVELGNIRPRHATTLGCERVMRGRVALTVFPTRSTRSHEAMCWIQDVPY